MTFSGVGGGRLGATLARRLGETWGRRRLSRVGESAEFAAAESEWTALTVALDATAAGYEKI